MIQQAYRAKKERRAHKQAEVQHQNSGNSPVVFKTEVPEVKARKSQVSKPDLLKKKRA